MAIVTPNWLFHSWQRGQAQAASSFPVPPFAGLRISVTGIESTEKRLALARIVEANGGAYCGDLSADCTHLVCDTNNLQTSPKSKYYWARAWRLQTVTLNWIYACLNHARALPSFP